MIREYVCGFCFSPERDKVVLTQKNRPDWQKGLWNGVGGKIEANELMEEAMSREFKEETGVLIEKENWKEFFRISGSDWIVYFFSTFNPEFISVKTMTDERVAIVSVDELSNYKTTRKINWLIPMTLDNSHLFGSSESIEA